MIIALGSDHAGFKVKQILVKKLQELEYEIIDVGADSGEVSVDYSDYAAKVALAVKKGAAQRGIVICGSGVGACIAANKFKGIRASVAHDLYSAAQGVEHDDMNVLCLGGKIVEDIAPQLAENFLKAVFQNKEPRFVRRLNKVLDIENANFK